MPSFSWSIAVKYWMIFLFILKFKNGFFLEKKTGIFPSNGTNNNNFIVLKVRFTDAFRTAKCVTKSHYFPISITKNSSRAARTQQPQRRTQCSFKEVLKLHRWSVQNKNRNNRSSSLNPFRTCGLSSSVSSNMSSNEPSSSSTSTTGSIIFFSAFHSWARIEKRVVHRDTDGERWNGRSRSQIAKVNKQLSIGTSPLPDPDVQDSARYIAILRI